jgi:hypothetical protein
MRNLVFSAAWLLLGCLAPLSAAAAGPRSASTAVPAATKVPPGPQVSLLLVNLTDISANHPDKAPFETTLRAYSTELAEKSKALAERARLAAKEGKKEEVARLIKELNDQTAASQKALTAKRNDLMQKIAVDIHGAIKKATHEDKQYVLVYEADGGNTFSGRHTHNLPGGLPNISFSVITYLSRSDADGSLHRQILPTQQGALYKISFDKAMVQHPRAKTMSDSLAIVAAEIKTAMDEKVAALKQDLQTLKTVKSKGLSEAEVAELGQKIRKQERALTAFRDAEKLRLQRLQAQLAAPLLRDVDRAIAAVLPAKEPYVVVSDHLGPSDWPSYQTDVSGPLPDITEEVIAKLKSGTP